MGGAPLGLLNSAGGAHLRRKAQGLIDRYGRETGAFGHQVLDLLKALMAVV